MSEVRAAEGEDFGCGVGEGAAEGLWGEEGGLALVCLRGGGMEEGSGEDGRAWVGKGKELLTRSSSLRPLAALVR